MMSSSFRHKVEYAVLRILLRIYKTFPIALAYKIFGVVSRMMWILLPKRRKTAIKNIQRVFVRLPKKECVNLAKKAFLQAGDTVAEILLLSVDRLRIETMIVNEKEAKKRLETLKKRHTGGWVVLTAHFSNWELMAHVLAKWGVKMVVVGRKGDNALIDQNITIPLRSRWGNKPIDKKGSAITIAKALKRGENVGILIDQKVHPDEAIRVKFLGLDAYTTPLVASLKRKFPQIVIVPIFLPRLSRGKYRLEIFDPIEITGTIEEMTQAYNDAIAKVIYRYPEQWLWMHDRFVKDGTKALS